MQARYQYGNLTIRKRKKGPDVWQFRWMENGKRKSVLIGTVEKLPTKADAERAVEHLRMQDQRAESATAVSLCHGGGADRPLHERVRAQALPENTQRDYRSLFKNHIRPRWGSEFVQNVKTMAVEEWLEDYAALPANEISRSKPHAHTLSGRASMGDGGTESG